VRQGAVDEADHQTVRQGPARPQLKRDPLGARAPTVLMTRIRHAFYLVLAIVGLPLGAWIILDKVAGAAFGWVIDMCGNELVARIPSPSSSRDLLIYERDCGATTRFNTQAMIVKRGRPLPSEPSPVLVLDVARERRRGFVGAPVVDGTWVSNDSVVIRFDAEVRVLRQRGRQRGVRVSVEHPRSAAPN
jgi:hypothetical protein